MTREDIIESLKEKSRKINLSKKISNRMKKESSFISNKKNKKSKKKRQI